MDPDTCYADLLACMAAEKYGIARRLAMDMRSWLINGGFCPHGYSRTEVDAYLAAVLRRTHGHWN